MRPMRKMPVLFIGHGSPMNIIEDNPWTRQWEAIAHEINRPSAILMISAHWYTAQTKIQTAPEPSMIYDMYGFPDELYQLEYKSKTEPSVISLVQSVLNGIESVLPDESRGYDHGNYAVLFSMYPEQDIPVIQLSVNHSVDARQWFRIGQALSQLRNDNVLIIGSGNIVHNLSAINPELGPSPYPEAEAFDQWVNYLVQNISNSDEVNTSVLEELLFWENAEGSDLAAQYPDHLAPFYYALGAAFGDSPKLSYSNVEVYCQDYLWGSLSMTSYKWD